MRDCLCPIRVKPAIPIGPNFFYGTTQDLREDLWMVRIFKFASENFDFVKFCKFTKKNILTANFCLFFVFNVRRENAGYRLSNN